MNLKIAFRVFLSILSISPPAFALRTNLNPEQVEALDRAHAEGDNFEWAVLTKAIRGNPRTVVIMGEGFVNLPEDSEIAKRVIDQFERFAVDESGPYTGRKTAQHHPNPSEPMNLTANGAKVKSIENAEQLYVWRFPDYLDATLGAATLASSLFSISYFVQAVRGPGVTQQRTAVMGGLLAGSVLVMGLRAVCPTCFPLGKSQAAAMAEFIDSWIKERGHEGPLVVVINKGLVDELRRILTRRYFFEAS